MTTASWRRGYCRKSLRFEGQSDSLNWKDWLSYKITGYSDAVSEWRTILLNNDRDAKDCLATKTCGSVAGGPRIVPRGVHLLMTVDSLSKTPSRNERHSPKRSTF